jgi:hypothetical protein
MIKVKIDDTIIDIIDKIEGRKTSDIILDFPLGHPILHNYISLKILKSKVGDKKLIIATNDRIGKKIGKRLWIEYSSIKDHNFLKEDSKGKLMEHNFTFWEYFKFQIHSYKKEISHSLDANKKLNSLWKYSRIYQEKTSIHIFLWALLLSILVFLFIYYFAISKTYISITPKVVIKKEAYNFIFKEKIDNSILWNNKYIKISTLSETLHSSDIYAATEVKRNLANISSWNVRIYNNTLWEVNLVPKTRLLNTQGILFELSDWVKIPAGINDNFNNTTPWYVDVRVISQINDISGKYIWKRWNIKENTSLLLPWLSIELQKDIYAESLEAFTWWNDDYQKIISKEDIESAEKIFTQKLKTEVIDSIKKNILLENRKNNSEIDILSWGKSIYYSEPIVQIEPWVKAWDIKDNFSISWNITAYVYTYSKVDIIQKLKTLLNEKNLTGIEKISHIDFPSLRMSQVIYTEKDPFEIKATFEIEALFLHDFLHKDNTYISTLKSEIRWLHKDNAEKILLNNPKISNVSINIRPFFTKNISNIYNNIVFKVE